MQPLSIYKTGGGTCGHFEIKSKMPVLGGTIIFEITFSFSRFRSNVDLQMVSSQKIKGGLSARI